MQLGYLALLLSVGWLLAYFFPYGPSAVRPKVWVRLVFVGVSVPLAFVMIVLFDREGWRISPPILGLLYCLWVALLLLAFRTVEHLSFKLTSLEGRSQRRWKRTVLALVFSFGLTAGLVIAHGTAMDGLGWFFAIGESRTVYARGYSEAAFKAVQPGDSEARVLQLLGPPLKTFDYPQIPNFTWAYSVDRLSKSHSYRRRQVKFGRDGRVIETQSFYELF